MLVVDPECPSQAILPRALRERHGADPQLIETGSAGGALALAESGCGIAMLPRSSVRPGGVLRVLPDLPRARLDVRAVWPERSWLPPAVAAVLELARRTGDGELATAARGGPARTPPSDSPMVSHLLFGGSGPEISR
ncbi:LysR substrate-binding domain-containing protein [Streptomyces sp. NPDC127110]|uniref:LysR substrate-binding domain-containing protein n=1 Tax=Streptomyces sp. NPDC127110 TaxID=3345362 RepID=UPI00362AF2DD